ncbi:mannan polymerase II complex ANP1 subunit [Nannizzia gypsea CBS 118893]|uniref:Mannan polymerase II complex ANP1 subunit n=1 Tax=Arthroderma gypseum (strain ATCC MYA-4604 / CBS 118893) TaxID=535722 RepID=E5R3F8_ARTGP|nr:mannan polymerase II complex ANP1 subunit [Nannizzia gypsea CBS 118893]EFQ98757.1 mannan polymerase II complex ANP1 subunit [Nannizzia gypsea CBS 118893]
MLLPKGGVTWKSAKSNLPPWKAVLMLLSKPRFIISIAAAGLVILLWGGVSRSTAEMQRYYCFGPSKPPNHMSANELVDWHSHLQTPVIFNHHEAYQINNTSIQNVNLNLIKATPKAAAMEERILILTPLRNAARHLDKYFDLLSMLTYPHHLIDIAFLVSDSNDETLADLAANLNRVQSMPDNIPFRSAMVVEKDFGATLDMNVNAKHGFEAQAPRRKTMAKARNFLLATALKPEHSWVYWRDVDIADSPPKIIEDFVAHNKDILVPNVWFHRYVDGHDIEGRFDYNSWVESDKGRKLAQSLDKDTIIVEGYKQFDTGRRYMAREGDWRRNKDEELELDGIGGVNIVVKADVHRAGINFPSYAFENQAETEGFAKMAKRAGYQVVGLPNYVVWHHDTEEKPGNV